MCRWGDGRQPLWHGLEQCCCARLTRAKPSEVRIRAVTETSARQGQTAVARAISREAERHLSEPLGPGLYVVATPIGHLGDISLRALSVLVRADAVYCEDTRHSARLLQHYGISVDTRPLHEHNEDQTVPRIVAMLRDGKRIAIISDAGTPLISDPGFKAVRAAAAAGLAVYSIPGPSSVVAALAVSGLATDQFTFAGFLPPKSAARRSRLVELQATPGTLVFFEAPQRLADSLADMVATLGDRPAVVARELTKLHEELARGTLAALAADFAGRDVKGEIVVLIGKGDAEAVSDEAISAALADALASLRLKDAATAVAEALSVPKARVYALGLRLKSGA
jgi:16S rRNA (cytidine1402-2'-O)-methyltransferase